MRSQYPSGILYIISAIALALLLGLLVGWNLILVENYLLQEEDPHFRWLILSVGCGGFLVLMFTIVSLVRYLVRTDERNSFQQLLLDSVTHELKSPLASAKLLLETMQLRELPRDKEIELRQTVLEELERLNHLVDHMLEAGREGRGRRNLEIRPVPIRQAVADVTELLRRRRGDDYSLRVSLDGAPEMFPTDAAALEIILFNLLDNAVKYSSGQADVELTISEDSRGALAVHVCDSGIGLERRDFRRVFRRFYRVRARRPEDRREGVGLGLFVVNELVTRLGGRVWARSEGEGQGATFSLHIPAIPSRQAARAEPELESDQRRTQTAHSST